MNNPIVTNEIGYIRQVFNHISNKYKESLTWLKLIIKVIWY